MLVASIFDDQRVRLPIILVSSGVPWIWQDISTVHLRTYGPILRKGVGGPPDDQSNPILRKGVGGPPDDQSNLLTHLLLHSFVATLSCVPQNHSD